MHNCINLSIMSQRHKATPPTVPYKFWVGHLVNSSSATLYLMPFGSGKSSQKLHVVQRAPSLDPEAASVSVDYNKEN